MKASLRGALVLATMILVAGRASATFSVEAVGDPVVGVYNGTDPWSQQFFALLFDSDPFTSLQFSIISSNGTHFEAAPTTVDGHVAGYSSTTAGWSEVSNSSTYIAAAGPADSHQNLYLVFSGDPVDNTISDPLQLVIDAYNGTEWVGSLVATYTSGPDHWTYEDTDAHKGPLVPEPVSMVMLGCLGAGILGARKLQNKTSK